MPHTPLKAVSRLLLLLVPLYLLAACSNGRQDELLTAPPQPAAGTAEGVLEASSHNAVRVILDTDLGIDVDDAGALAVLHALADKGEAKILATVANVNDPHAPGALDAINTYYGRPNIPVGKKRAAAVLGCYPLLAQLRSAHCKGP